MADEASKPEPIDIVSDPHHWTPEQLAALRLEVPPPTPPTMPTMPLSMFPATVADFNACVQTMEAMMTAIRSLAERVEGLEAQVAALVKVLAFDAEDVAGYRDMLPLLARVRGLEERE